MKYYFYFIDEDKLNGRGINGYQAAKAVTREHVYANQSDWVSLTTQQTSDVCAYLTSGHNMGRDNIVCDDKAFVIHSSFLDVSDTSNLFTVFVCTRDIREITVGEL